MAYFWLPGGGYLAASNLPPAPEPESEPSVVTDEDLAGQIAAARAEEDSILESAGFGEDFYAALTRSSELVDLGASRVAEKEEYSVPSESVAELGENDANDSIAFAIGLVSAVAGFAVIVASIVLFVIKLRQPAPNSSWAVPQSSGHNPFVALVLFVGISVAAFALVNLSVAPALGAPSPSSSYTLHSIKLSDFATNYTDYIAKLVPGSNDPSAPDYYASADFQNSAASHAVFNLDNGTTAEIYEGEIGFLCNATGIRSFMVDFSDESGATSLAKVDHSSRDIQYGATDLRTRAEKAAMLQNTMYLQYVEYCDTPVSTITIPRGVYYFATGHSYPQGREPYVIRPVDGVSISGSGIGSYAGAIRSSLSSGNANAVESATANGTNATILKPYTLVSYAGSAAPDMFYFNDYAESNFDNPAYLRNVHYQNFIIDGEDAAGHVYTSAGKGFMYNLFENVSWYYVVVKNTDGTGFGVDSPRGNSYINYCAAINNGKTATPGRGDGEYPGASGFGIGVGYSDGETFSMSNSVAYGNAKFGFFYEHQNRFHLPGASVYPYDAIDGNFSITNSVSSSNWYNYGGMRAYDVSLSGSVSHPGCTGTQAPGTYYEKQTCTQANLYYSDDTRNVKTSNLSVDVTFDDVQDKSSWFYDAVYWGVKNGIIYGETFNSFGVGNMLKRQDLLIILWRMMGYPGETVTRRNGNQNPDLAKQWYVETGFSDVAPNSYYAAAVKWAKDRGVIIGTGGGNFSPQNATKREEVVLMLWRLANKPTVSNTPSFTDLEDANEEYKQAIAWAESNGISNGISATEFGFGEELTRAQAITLIYRFYQKYHYYLDI